MAATRQLRLGLAGGTLLAVHACVAATATRYDPTTFARTMAGRISNPEAGVPPQCYTKTGGASNPCWACHTIAVAPNLATDWQLQESYAFSAAALENHWTNLFAKRTQPVDSDARILAWIRQDNYTRLRRDLETADYPGWRPDLDLFGGFDAAGFARDGSGWRAVRFKPFPGTFWPTGGSTSDVFVRLPERFRRDARGRDSRAIYRDNLRILEAAIATPRAALPEHYAGGASAIAVHRGLYPAGTEFLHTVRYVDPDAPALFSRRLKELRYARKTRFLDAWARVAAHEAETEDKERGLAPVYAGSALVGLRNGFGWQLQAFIEDREGRLRLQTDEEHRYCMGCHGALGVTVDHTFAFARKLPGDAGWRHQDLRGMKDAPQTGHDAPEILRWLRRARGGDEFRANAGMLARFFPGGKLDETAVRRASPGGDRDLAWLLTPSRRRALDLAKAYRTIVRAQSYVRGRDAFVGPVVNVWRRIENGSTELVKTGRVFTDGRLRLDW